MVFLLYWSSASDSISWNHLMKNIQYRIGYNYIYMHTIPYHPQTNGMAEHFKITVFSKLGKLQETQQNNWDEYLEAFVFACSTCVNKTTKYTPYELPRDYFIHLHFGV